MPSAYERRKLRIAESLSRGLCFCGLPLKEGRKQCHLHLASATHRSKRCQASNKAMGLCPCGNERAESRMYCRRCLDVAWVRTQSRNKDLKRRACAHFGNICSDCYCSFLYPEVFDFHHLDPSVKVDKVSDLITRSRPWEVILVELEKCVMLCANCHRIRHAKESK